MRKWLGISPTCKPPLDVGNVRFPARRMPGGRRTAARVDSTLPLYLPCRARPGRFDGGYRLKAAIGRFLFGGVGSRDWEHALPAC